MHDALNMPPKKDVIKKHLDLSCDNFFKCYYFDKI